MTSWALALPAYSVTCVVPLGIESAVNAVDPEYVSTKDPLELVTVKTDAVVTELLQVSPLLLIPHLPFEVVRVKPLPDVVAVSVAHVWVLHVP